MRGNFYASYAIMTSMTKKIIHPEPSRRIGIHHKDCLDGTASAAILLKKFPEILLRPLSHHYTEDTLGEIVKEIDSKTIVYIVDFSLREDHTEKLLEKADEVINIDHHIGAEEKLRALDTQYENFTYVFNNNRSGASLAWEYFYDRKTIPELVLLIEDGDIGKFEFPDKTKWSGGVLMPLMNQPAKVLELFEKPIQTILSEGKVATDFMDFLIEMYCARNEPISLQIGEHTVVAYNANFNVERMRSTLGHILVEKHHATVALFRISRDEVAFSFRGLDVVEPSALALASMLGGNGHRNAAGAAVSLKKFCEMIKK